MAGSITHAYFAMDVYDKLDVNKKKLLKKYQNNLRCFAQGHDVFHFITNKSEFFHTNKTRDFFMNMINYIKDNNLYNNPEVLSFLYGYISHYNLDKNVHPYVHYKTGKYYKDNKNSYKYKGKHSELETYIDSYMIRNREKIDPWKFKSHKFCLSPYKFSNELNDLIDYTFYETYKENNIGKIYYKGIKKMYHLYSLLRNDRFKIKNKMYRLVDKITPQKFYKFTPVSFAIDENKEYYLNNDHKEWYHPLDKNEKHNESFMDLYDKALKDTVYTIKELDKFFNNKKNDIDKMFDNSSFSTGKDCNIKDRLKYFEN